MRGGTALTTPASNINTAEGYFPPITELWLNAAGEVTNTREVTFHTVVDCTRAIRPASSTSPVRDDGSRAPKGWSNRWGRCVASRVSCRVDYLDLGRRRRWLAPFAIRGVSASPTSNSLEVMSHAGGLGWSNGSSLGWPSNVTSLAVTKLRLEILDGKAQWGTTLGEMRSTVKGLQQASNDILSAVSFIGRRARAARRDVLDVLFNVPPRKRKRKMSTESRIKFEKKILDLWLQAQFSIKPLFADIEQSAEALSWLLFEEKRPMRFTAKAGARDSWNSTWVTPWPRNSGAKGDLHTYLSAQAEEHYSVVYSLEPTTQTTYQQLGLTNVAAVAWELTQFSWMVDYVLGVGDWLNSMVSLDGATFVEGSRSRKGMVWSRKIPVQLHPRNNVKIHSFGAPIPDYEVGRFQRDVLTGIPGPALRPPVRSRLGLNQLANVLAVVAQLSSGSSVPHNRN